MALVQRITRLARDQYVIPESLTHSSGTISATVNGIGYTCSLSGLTANTLYFLYLRPGQANIQFVTTVPSSYRALFSQAILIGAFYSNNMTTPSFGAFVTIEGKPTSALWDTNSAIPTSLRGSTSNPSFGTLDTNIYKLRRDGEEIVGEWFIRQTTQGTAGSGTYLIVHPFTLDRSYYINTGAPGTTYRSSIGFIHIQEHAPGTWVGNNDIVIPFDTFGTDNFIAPLGLVGPGNTTLRGDWGPVVPLGGSGQQLTITIKYRYKVSGWTNTPLKDL